MKMNRYFQGTPARFAFNTGAMVGYHREDGSLFASNPQEDVSMTDAVKKTTKKSTAKAKTTTKPAKNTAPANGHRSNVTEIGISHEQIAMLAHRYWAERGRQHGHDAEDWFRAEEELRGKAS
jgi:hypothetical protein